MSNSIFDMEEREKMCAKQNELESRRSQLEDKISEVRKTLSEMTSEVGMLSDLMSALCKAYDLDVHNEDGQRIWTVYE